MTDAERRQRAEEMFTDTHSRYMKNWAVISSLRQFRDAALEGTAQRLTQQHAAFVDLFRTEPEYRRIFMNPEQPVPENILQIFQAQMTQGVVINAHAAIDAPPSFFPSILIPLPSLSFPRFPFSLPPLRS